MQKKTAVKRMLKQIDLGKGEVFTLPDLIVKEKQKILNKKSQVVHILGSGWSLNESKKNINPQDFVIGFNFTGNANLQLDMYLFEFGGYKYFDTSQLHLKIAKDIVLPSGASVYFKNLWENKNDVQYINKYITPNGIPILKDYLIPCLDQKYLKSILTHCLLGKSEYLPQYSSTAITAVFLSAYLGFKTIVLHGVDFGGKYFYETEGFEGSENYLPTHQEKSYYKPVKNSDTHVTAVGSTGMKAVIPLLRDMLGAENITLFAGCKTTPLAKMLPVYSVEQKLDSSG